MKVVKGALLCATCPDLCAMDLTKERKMAARLVSMNSNGTVKESEVMFSCVMCEQLAVVEVFARRMLAAFD